MPVPNDCHRNAKAPTLDPLPPLPPPCYRGRVAAGWHVTATQQSRRRIVTLSSSALWSACRLTHMMALMISTSRATSGRRKSRQHRLVEECEVVRNAPKWFRLSSRELAPDGMVLGLLV